jgi:hypothetical protein
MKSTIIVLATLVCAFSVRTATAQPVEWGIVGGTTIGDVATSGPQTFDANSNAGGAVGLFLGSSRDRAVGVHTEALFTWRRFSADIPGGPLHASARALEVPVLLRARVVSLKSSRVWVDAGPQVARIFTITQTIGPLRTHVTDQFKHVDIAAVFGGGVGSTIGGHQVMFGARMVHGFRDLDPLPSQSLKSRAVQVLASYGF